MRDRFADIRAAHMVNDDDPGQSFQKRRQLSQISRLEIDHDVPAKMLHPGGACLKHLPWSGIDQTLDEIETDATHPSVMQLL